MKKLLIFIFILILMFSGCSKKEPEEINVPFSSADDNSSSVSGSVPLPLVFINGKYYYTFPDFPDCGISDEKFVPEGYTIYRETKSIRKLGEKEGNHIAFSGSPFAFSGDKLYVKIRTENGFHWVEMIPAGNISSFETSRKADTQNSSSVDSTTSCVPDISISSGPSAPSYIHSSDTSSNISSAENIHYFKGRVVNSLPKLSDSPNAAIGNENVLKRWYFAIADTSEISQLLVQSSIADEYELHFDDANSVIETLRSITPGTEPKTENPSVGSSYTVAAFDFEEKELWRVTLDGYLFVVCFGGENASYVFDMTGQDYSKIIGIGNYSLSMSQP